MTLIEILKFKYPNLEFVVDEDSRSLISAPPGFVLPDRRTLEEWGAEIKAVKENSCQVLKADINELAARVTTDESQRGRLASLLEKIITGCN